MAWLLKTICNALLKSLTGMFEVLAGDFVSVLGINIGAAGFPTIVNGQKVGGSNLVDILSNYPSQGADLFDQIFPMASFKKLMVIMALVLLITLTAAEILKVFWAAPARNDVQHPATTIIKFLFVGLCCVGAYRIMIAIEYVANSLYVEFGKRATNIAALGVDSSYSEVFTDVAGNSEVRQNLLFENPLEKMTTTTLNISGSAGELMWSLVCLVVTYLVVINFVKLLIEVIERYVVLGLLFYTCPVPFATLVSPSTSGIFGQWLKMIFSHMLLLITGSMFINVFLAGLIYVSNATFDTVTVWLVYMFMLVGFLQVAQRFDDYLNGLGLSTARTGSRLAAETFLGMRAISGMASTAVRTGSMAAKGISALSGKSAVGGAKAGLDKPKTLEKGSVLSKAASDIKNNTQGATIPGNAATLAKGINEAAEKGVISGTNAKAAQMMLASKTFDGISGRNTKDGVAFNLKSKDGSALALDTKMDEKGNIVGMKAKAINSTGGAADVKSEAFQKLNSATVGDVENTVKSAYGIGASKNGEMGSHIPGTSNEIKRLNPSQVEQYGAQVGMIDKNGSVLATFSDPGLMSEGQIARASMRMGDVLGTSHQYGTESGAALFKSAAGEAPVTLSSASGYAQVGADQQLGLGVQPNSFMDTNGHLYVPAAYASDEMMHTGSIGFITQPHEDGSNTTEKYVQLAPEDMDSFVEMGYAREMGNDLYNEALEEHLQEADARFVRPQDTAQQQIEEQPAWGKGSLYGEKTTADYSGDSLYDDYDGPMFTDSYLDGESLYPEEE